MSTRSTINQNVNDGLYDCVDVGGDSSSSSEKRTQPKSSLSSPPRSIISGDIELGKTKTKRGTHVSIAEACGSREERRQQQQRQQHQHQHQLFDNNSDDEDDGRFISNYNNNSSINNNELSSPSFESAAKSTASSTTRKRASNQHLLGTAFLSFSSFALVQTVAAYIAGSEAMYGDSAAMMVDSLTYLFNWYAEKQKTQYDDAHQTLGSYTSQQQEQVSTGIISMKRLQQRERRKFVLQLELIPPFVSVSALIAVTIVVLYQSISVIILDSKRDVDEQGEPNMTIMICFAAANLLLDFVNVFCFAKAKHLLGYQTIDNTPPLMTAATADDILSATSDNSNINNRNFSSGRPITFKNNNGIVPKNKKNDRDRQNIVYQSLDFTGDNSYDDDDDYDDGDKKNSNCKNLYSKRKSLGDKQGKENDNPVETLFVVQHLCPQQQQQQQQPTAIINDDDNTSNSNSNKDDNSDHDIISMDDVDYDDEEDDDDDAEEKSANLNMCSAYTHVFADTLRSIAVVLAAGIAAILGDDYITPEIADTVAAIIVSVLILFSLIPLFQGMIHSSIELKNIYAEEEKSQELMLLEFTSRKNKKLKLQQQQQQKRQQQQKAVLSSKPQRQQRTKKIALPKKGVVASLPPQGSSLLQQSQVQPQTQSQAK